MKKTPEEVASEAAAEAICGCVQKWLERHPRLSLADVEVKTLPFGRGFSVEMKSSTGEAIFCDAERGELRGFFTGEFKEEMGPQLHVLLEWKNFRPHTVPKDRCTQTCVWEIERRDESGVRLRVVQAQATADL